MKICPLCKTENDDKFIFCQNCHRSLPKVTHLENLRNMGIFAFEKNDFQKAIKYFDDILKLNVGDKEAWLLKAAALTRLKLMSEVRKCYDSAGILYTIQRCTLCRGFKRCQACEATGVCTMCNGRRKCMMCKGTGTCPACNGTGADCKACRGTGNCFRCGGTKECVYCKGNGYCKECNGLGVCGLCGGTGELLRIDINLIPEKIRKYVVPPPKQGLMTS